MVFYPPAWVPKLPFDPPDSIPINEFMFNEKYGRHPLAQSKPPFTCGLDGTEYSAIEVQERVDKLARALSQELGWAVNQGTEWDKVAAIFSVNTIDTLTVSWAIHRLSGVSSPVNAAYSRFELVHQLKSSGSKALFTCAPLLSLALEAAAECGIPRKNVFLFSLPKAATGGAIAPQEFRTVDAMIELGASLPPLEELKWEEGQGARQTAFLCYSSGTSGLPKGVMISHRNVIANVLQISTYESKYRRSLINSKSDSRENILGLLPNSHIYSLVVICHTHPYRGDQVVNLPKFEINQFLQTIERFNLNSLYLVPPIIIIMAKNKSLCDKYNLQSVRSLFTGAAPLGFETAEELQRQYPSWKIRQGYGMTETSTVVLSSAHDDIWFGSSGSILPAVEAKIMSTDGKEITEYDKPGELVIKSPSGVLGYLNNEKATRETFQDGWVRTGDEALVRVGPKGTEHVFVVDRIKELIKVKGLQVAPAELEAHLLDHPAVADACVIPVPDEAAGEIPKAYVVKSSSVGLEDNDRMLIRDIQKHVEKEKARHKWLKGGVEFIDVIPKSPSGKILRRMLRDREREARRQKGAKL